jgi:hypothetical protein
MLRSSASTIRGSWPALSTRATRNGRWLVLNVGWPGGPAGCDGPPCSPDLVSTRWFFRASLHGWQTITATRTAGCTQVRTVEPQFPARLCAGLPALGGARQPHTEPPTPAGCEEAKTR